MEFSDTYKHSGPCCFSPNAQLLAAAVDYRLVIRDVASLKVLQLYSCLDKINYVEWAPDSQYVLCGLYKKALVQVWSVLEPEWTCKIDEGSAGISHARWSPDSRHILTTSDFQIRLTVWSLVSTACVHMQWPKQVSRGVSFTADGSFVVVATRKECKDYINILSCHSWEIMGTHAVDTTDLSDVEWSPTGSTIAVWDSSLEYKVLLYSPDGRCLQKFQAYDNALGIKTVAWSPCGKFLGIGSFDQVARVLNHLTLKPVAELAHTSLLKGPATAVLFKEIEEPWLDDFSNLYLQDNDTPRYEKPNEGATRVRYKVVEFPLTIPSLRPHPDKPNPRQGIGLLSWSADSNYILTRNDNMPIAVWIWDVRRLQLAAILVHRDAVRAASWDPIAPRVAICTGSSHLFMWTPAGACCVNVPLPQFTVTDIKWNASGSSLLLKDNDAFCCTFVPVLSEFGTEAS